MARIRLKPIEQQVVVVVGASSGIGRNTALRFAERGASVVVAARNAAGLQSLVDQIAQTGGRALAVVADVTDFDQVQAIADQTIAAYGRIDTWINLAGVVVYATFSDTTPEEWRRTIDVNLNGQAYGAMVALPHLKRSGGALICVSSVTAKRSFPLISAYGASKQGINGMLESLRVELAQEGAPVSVTNVLPASINTPLFSHARTKIGVKPKPAAPVYQPGVVSDVIVYAAEHPVPEIYAGGAARAMPLPQLLSVRLMDALVQQFGFRTQQTDLPKSADAPTNVFAPTAHEERVEGDYSAQARRWSLYHWITTRPAARWVLRGSALGALAWLAWRRQADA